MSDLNISQDIYDKVTEYVRENPEGIAKASVAVAEKLMAAGWDIDSEDLYDVGLGTGVVMGLLIRGMYERSLYENDTPGDFSKMFQKYGEFDITKMN